MTFNKAVSFWVFILFVCRQALAVETILINKPIDSQDRRKDYPKELLVEVLKATESKYGPFELKYSIAMGSLWAKLYMTKDGYGDVIHSASRLDWDKELIPVRIPIMRGMLGLRVFLINKDKQPTFAKVNTVEQLKTLALGSGYNWAVTKLFEHHGFKVVTAENYLSIFSMLKNNRFDYFPRGLNEILPEYDINFNSNSQLHVEETILLHIPLPVYFYVNSQKPKLAKRIEEGLLSVKKDGIFDHLFLKYFKDVKDKFNVKNRKIFYLENPGIAENLPQEDPLKFFDE